MSAEELRKTLDALQAEKAGRRLGVVGSAAAAVGEWLSWLSRPDINIQPHSETADPPGPPLKSGRRERPARATTATHSSVDEPSEPETWTRFAVTVEDPDDEGNVGTIEEAEYGVAGGEILVRDLDGRIIATHRLAGEDVAVVARCLLRKRYPRRRSNVIQFPKMGVA